MKLTIETGQVHEYVVPLRRTFATSRREIEQTSNHFVFLEGRRDDGVVVQGTGETSARNVRITSDPPRKLMSFFRQCLNQIQGYEIRLASTEAAIEDVRIISQQLLWIAEKTATNVDSLHNPFSACRCGVEMALLDLTARALGMSITDLLGRKREFSTVTARTFSLRSDALDLKERIRASASSMGAWRLKGGDNVDSNIDCLLQMQELAHELHLSSQTFWLDINEAMSPDQAFNMASRIQLLAEQKTLAGRVIIEQPVEKHQLKVLCELQAALKPSSKHGLDVLIMADEALHMLNDWDDLLMFGRCDAVNIKIQKTGGLIAALDLATHIHSTHPDVEVYLGSMIGASDLTAYAIHQLACAMPRLDHNTATPKTGLKWNVINPQLKLDDEACGRVQMTGPGLGAGVNIPLLSPLITASTTKCPLIHWTQAERHGSQFRINYKNPALFHIPEGTDGAIHQTAAFLLGGWSVHCNGYFTYSRMATEIKPNDNSARIIKDWSAAIPQVPASAPKPCGQIDNTPYSKQRKPIVPYHALVIGRNLIRLVKINPAELVGDGQSSIKQLIRNENRYRSNSPCRANGLIRTNSPALNEKLVRSGYTIDSVPDSGEIVSLSSKGIITAPYVVTDVTETTSPEVIEAIRSLAIEEVAQRPYHLELSMSEHRKKRGSITLEQARSNNNIDWPIFATPHCIESFNEESYEHRNLQSDLLLAMALSTLVPLKALNELAQQLPDNRLCTVPSIISVRIEIEESSESMPTDSRVAQACNPALVLWERLSDHPEKSRWMVYGESLCIARVIKRLDDYKMAVTPVTKRLDLIKAEDQQIETAHLEITEVLEAEEYKRWTQTLARLHGLAGWICNHQHEVSTIFCCVTGKAHRVALFLMSLRYGPNGSTTCEIKEIQIGTSVRPRFDFIRLPPGGHCSPPDSGSDIQII